MDVRLLNHIGVSVRDLDATVAWYREMLGIEPTFEQRGTSGPVVEEVVQVEGAVIDMAYCVLGNTCLEFLEYREPPIQDYTLRNCDVGATHICFEVENIDEVYQRLVQRGVTFSTPPGVIEDGPLEGISFAYFRDLNGLQLELFQLPADSIAKAM